MRWKLEEECGLNKREAGWDEVQEPGRSAAPVVALGIGCGAGARVRELKNGVAQRWAAQTVTSTGPPPQSDERKKSRGRKRTS